MANEFDDVLRSFGFRAGPEGVNVTIEELVRLSTGELETVVMAMKDKIRMAIGDRLANWYINAVEGQTSFIALGPPDEFASEQRREQIIVQAIFLESVPKAERTARRWLEGFQHFIRGSERVI